MCRAIMACLNYLINLVRRTLKDGFHTSVQHIAHPAAQPQAASLFIDPGPEEDPLDAAGDINMRTL